MNSMKMMLMAVLMVVSAGQISSQSVNKNKDNVANNGYDVVNYFATNTAARGSSDFKTTHRKAVYYFASADNLNAFKANPDKYLPQYDGYCAFAVAKMNKKVPVDPETFRIDDGKLYLFYNDFWEGKPFNTIVPWINSESELEAMAETNWKTLKSAG
jgi:YHS domain-containing protein